MIDIFLEMDMIVDDFFNGIWITVDPEEVEDGDQ